MNEVTSKVKIMIIIGVVLLITCSFIVVSLTKQNQESDLIQLTSTETDSGISIVSVSPTVITATATSEQFMVKEYTKERADGYYDHNVIIINRKDNRCVGTITLSCVHNGKKQIATFEIDVLAFGHTTIDFPGASNQPGMMGTKIEAFIFTRA